MLLHITWSLDETLRVGIGNFPIIGDSVAQFGGRY